MTAIANYITGSVSTSREMKEKLITGGINWNLRNKCTDKDLEQHFRLRDAILNQGFKEGRITIEQFHQVEDFEISFTKQMIEYKIPGTNHTVGVAFEEITDRTAINALNYLIGRANKEQFYNETFPMIGPSKLKSNATGPVPLQRKSGAAKALASHFPEARQKVMPSLLAQTPDVTKDRKKIVKRIEHAEFIATRMTKQLSKKIQQRQDTIKRLESLRPQPEDAGRQIATLKGSVREFEALKKKFETLDVYALTTALTALPVGRYHYDDLESVTNHVQNQVRTDLEGRLTKSRLPWKKSALDESDEAYIKGVAGLLHKSRGEYAMYCKKQEMTPERESLEDLIFREALRVSDGIEFDASIVKSSAILSTMTPELKAEVGDLFDELDRLASVKAHFPDDTRAYRGKDVTQLAAQITSRRNQIHFDGTNAPARSHRIFNARNAGVAGILGGAVAAADRMGLEPVRRIQELGQLGMSNPVGALGNISNAFVGMGIAKRWWNARGELPYLLTGGALLTGAAMTLMGTSEPMQVFQAAMAKPQYAVALASTAHLAAKAVYDFVRPESNERTGPYSQRQRNMNWNRLVVGGVAAGALIMGGLSLSESMDTSSIGENPALGFVMSGIDTVWKHYFLASMALPVIGYATNAIEQRVHGPAGRALSAGVRVLENVASVGSAYYFASRISGFFSWTSAKTATGSVGENVSTCPVGENVSTCPVGENVSTCPVAQPSLSASEGAGASLAGRVVADALQAFNPFNWFAGIGQDVSINMEPGGY